MGVFPDALLPGQTARIVVGNLPGDTRDLRGLAKEVVEELKNLLVKK
jgi:hypothetical protein